MGRVHQEDFCQALGVTPEQKYTSERGPNFRTSFDLLRKVARVPAPALLALMDAAIFNVIIGNADAHGKNFSRLYASSGLRLVPPYDLPCTSFYSEVHASLAMRMGGVNRLEEFTPESLPGFAAQVELGEPYVCLRAQALAKLAGPAIVRAADGFAANGFGTETIRAIGRHVVDRRRRLLDVIAATTRI